MTLDLLLKGKETLIKGKHYGSTASYVEPFLERMAEFTDDFLIEVKLPSQMTLDNNVNDITYNRVLVQAVLPQEYTIDNHDEVYGMVYGLDVAKPIFKFYRGHLNRACTNLTVFNPTWLTVQEINVDEGINYKSIDKLIETDFNFKKRLEELKHTFHDKKSINEMFGGILDRSLRYSYDNGITNTKLPETMLPKVYKSLFLKEDSPYFIGDKELDTYTLINAFTQCITDGKADVMNRAEKTLLVNNIIGI